MLLSFSIPSMLPMIVNGLEDAGHEVADSVFEWAASHFPTELAAANGRIKRQTIRQVTGPSSPWPRLIKHRTRYGLDLWWKSRTPNRRRLGCVPVKQAFRVSIRRWSDGTPVVIADNAIGMDITKVAQADGFETIEEFLAFFIPKPGDRFDGVLIRW